MTLRTLLRCLLLIAFTHPSASNAGASDGTCAVRGRARELRRHVSFERASRRFPLSDPSLLDFAISRDSRGVLHLAGIARAGDLDEVVFTSIPSPSPFPLERSKFRRGDVIEVWSGDYDGDGRADVACIETSRRTAVIWLQRSAGSFERLEAEATPLAKEPFSLTSFKSSGVETLTLLASPPDTEGVVDLISISDAGATAGARQLLERHNVPIAIAAWSARSDIELLVQMRNAPIFQVAARADVPYYVWGELPLLPRPIAFTPGDYNADGLYDLAVIGPPAFGGWMLENRGQTAIERPFAKGPVIGNAFRRLRSADVDDDGLIDLIVLQNGELTLYENNPADPAARVAVHVAGSGDDGPSVTPDEEGRFRLSAPCGRKTTLIARTVSGDREVRKEIDCECGGVTRADVYLGPPPVPHATTNYLASDRPNGPYICTGYSPASQTHKWGRQGDTCPPSHAVIELDDNRFGAGITCCPLPEPDILRGETEWLEARECPENTVLTGARLSESGHGPTFVGCTPIDTTRYRLGPRRPGRQWGTGLSSKGFRFGIARSELPLALQPGLGRASYNRWDIDGCVGDPPGSIAVSPLNQDCKKTVFRSLERLTGDGSAVPVRMFPSCVELDNMFDPEGGCREAGSRDGGRKPGGESR